jgi:hypothetical protein
MPAAAVSHAQIIHLCTDQGWRRQAPVTAHTGGYLKRGWDKPWWSGVCALQACR